MNNAEYWAHRFKIMEDALNDQAFEYVEHLEKQFDYAIRDIETQMRAWYQRFADNNKITLAEAKRLLKTDELEEFKWTVQEYIEKGKEMNLNGAWMKELENASARVHISRLDSLKLQLRHQAEVLAQKEIEAITDASTLSYTESYYHTAFEVQRGLGVGWTMQALNEETVKKVLAQPWSVDNNTFTARCWTNKTKLIETVNREITRMMATGAAPDKAIAAIAKQFNTSKSNAGRVVMTESSAFSSVAQKDSFNELGVEQYVIVCALDKSTCEFCGEMDGKVFNMSDYVVGVTANPFHPWCRCCTAPYFADMQGIGERFARDIETDKAYKLPKDTTYKQWRTLQSQKTLEKSAKSGIIKSIDVDDYETAVYGKNISDDVSKCILETMRECEKQRGFVISEISAKSIPKTIFGTPVLQIEPLSNGLLQLNLNTDKLAGKTLKEIDRMFAATDDTVVMSLQEAVIHESGHAASIWGKSISEIESFYDELSEIHIEGISSVALGDGAECLAEIEVLRYRGEDVSEEAKRFYEKYMRRKY